MKKICFVVSAPFVANAFLPHHIEILKTRFDIYVIANFNEELAELSLPQLEDHHTQHIAIERNIHPISDLKALVNLQRYFSRMKFDAVHSITPKAGLLSMIAAKLAGVKNRIHIFTGQVWYTKKGFIKTLLMLIDKVIVKFSTVILVDGESQRKFLIDNHIVNAKNSRVFGKGSISGVDLLRFSPKPTVREKIRETLSLSENDIVFTFLGRINKDKGVIDLANAFKTLIEEYPYAKLLIVGYDEGNLKPLMVEITKNDKSVIFYGPTSEPEIVLQAADVVCLPSYREGFGTSVIEASLLGIPIICSDTYGLMDTIVENQTGLRHKVGDVLSLSAQMKRLAISAELRKYLGDNGRNYVLNNFSADDVSKHWLDFYVNMLMNKSNPGLDKSNQLNND